MGNNISTLGYTKGLIGFSQGLAIYIFSTQIHCPEAFIVALFVPLVIIQGLGNIRDKTLAIWSVSLIAVLVLLTYYNIWRTGLENVNSSIPLDFFLVCCLAIFIAQSLITACDIDKKRYPSYTTCFDVSWKLTTQLFLSISFVGISFSLLAISTVLLDYVSVPLSRIVSKPWFPYVFIPSVLAIALHLTDVKLAMLRALRVLYLNFVSALLPVTVLVVTIFLLGVLVSILRHTEKIISADTLESIFFFLIIEINSVYLDGKSAISKAGLKQKYTSYAAKFLLVPLVIMIIFLRAHDIERTGISVYYIYDIAFMSILTFYAVGYAIAGFSSGTWLKGLELCNYVGALLIIATLIALYSPLLDPAKIAISFQEKRFLAGQTQALDYTNRQAGLRWGTEAGNKYHLNKPVNQTTFTPGNQTTYTPVVRPKPMTESDKKSRVYAHKPGKDLPESFFQQDWSTLGYDIPCLQNSSNPQCKAWVMPLGDDTQDGIILFNPIQYVFYYIKQVNNKWTVAGYWKLAQRCFAIDTSIMNDVFDFIKVPQMPNIEVQGFQAAFEPVGQKCPEVHLNKGP